MHNATKGYLFFNTGSAMTSHIKTLLLLALLSGLVITMGGVFGGKIGLIIAFILAITMNFGAYWYSDTIILRMYKAKAIEYGDSPNLYNALRRISSNARIPMPRLYSINDSSPNAFATGRNPEHGVVAITTGLIKILSPAEISAVLAHEVGHIVNRDIFIQTLVAIMASIITSLANFLQLSAFFSGANSTNSSENRGNIFSSLLFAFLAPIAAAMIQFSISRSREFLADESGAYFHGNPKDLASALEKIESYVKHKEMQSATPSTAHMLIISPFANTTSFSSLFSTHPPTQERIAKLNAMAEKKHTTHFL
ncbi:MAG: zinc metalloprotease HtpX [Desulfovibrionaceae bacterium]